MMADMTWFREAKYGLFIHWGLFSVLAGEYQGQKTDRIAEWIMNYLHIPVEEYEKLAGTFDPKHFDADEIVRMAKEEWGMRYLVVTSKHHEGFAMFHSKCSAYNVVDASPYGRDVIGELSNACHKYGMRFGLYYSQAQDWDDPNGFAYGYDNTKKDFEAYFTGKCLPQVRELLTNYGKIDLLWFDTPMGITKEQTERLIALVRTLQPDCVISGRVGNHMGDYMTTGDNYIPRLPYEKDWEVPATLNDTWGFSKFDHNWKEPDDIIRRFLKINSRGGNYLLNIGPNADGVVPKESVEILNEVGKFVKENASALFGTKRAAVYPYELEWAEFTQKDHFLFIHILKPQTRIEIINFANRVKNVSLVRTGEALEYETGKKSEGDGYLEIELPNDLRAQKNYSIAVELVEKDVIFESIKD